MKVGLEKFSLVSNHFHLSKVKDLGQQPNQIWFWDPSYIYQNGSVLWFPSWPYLISWEVFNHHWASVTRKGKFSMLEGAPCWVRVVRLEDSLFKKSWVCSLISVGHSYFTVTIVTEGESKEPLRVGRLNLLSLQPLTRATPYADWSLALPLWCLSSPFPCTSVHVSHRPKLYQFPLVSWSHFHHQLLWAWESVIQFWLTRCVWGREGWGWEGVEGDAPGKECLAPKRVRSWGPFVFPVLSIIVCIDA